MSLCAHLSRHSIFPDLAASLILNTLGIQLCVSVMLLKTSASMQPCWTNVVALWDCPFWFCDWWLKWRKPWHACFSFLYALVSGCRDPGTWMLLLKYSTSHCLVFVLLSKCWLSWGGFIEFSVSMGLEAHFTWQAMPTMTLSFGWNTRGLNVQLLSF